VMMDGLESSAPSKHSRQGKGMLSNILALFNRTVPGRSERINGSEILRLAFLRRGSSSSSTPRRISGPGMSTVVRVINTLSYLWLLTKTV
jgi:hypothetical protein